MMSTGVSFAPSSLVISPTCRIWGNRNLVTAIGKASISLAQTGSMPLRTAARGKPPMPSNRLPIVIFLSGASGLFSSFLIFSLLFKKFFLSPLAFRPIGKGWEHFLRFSSLFTESSQFERENRAISAKNSRKNRPQTEACGFKSSLAGKISLGSTSKNGQQKTPKPLKFRGFLGGYLFRIHNMVREAGLEPARPEGALEPESPKAALAPCYRAKCVLPHPEKSLVFQAVPHRATK